MSDEFTALLTVEMTDAERDDNEDELDRIVADLRGYDAIRSVEWRQVAQCTCCDQVGPGAPGAGGAAHICDECAAPA